MSVRVEHPLAFALGCLVGAIVADALVIGGSVWAYAAHWWGQRCGT